MSTINPRAEKVRNALAREKSGGQPGKIILIFGKKGTGKSTLSRALVKASPRLLVYDPMAEHSACGEVVSKFSELIEKSKQKKFKLVYRSVDDYYSRSIFETEEEAFENFCSLAAATRNVDVMVDEIDRYCSPHGIPKDLNAVVQYGRLWRVQLIGISRRPQEVSKNLTALAAVFYLGKITEPRDAEYFQKYTGDPELLERLEELEDFQFLRYEL